ncbi:unnamed protein product [Urochloa humidicola]
MRKAVINGVLFQALTVVLDLAAFYFVRRRRRCRGCGGRSVLPSHGGGAKADRFQAAGGSGSPAGASPVGRRCSCGSPAAIPSRWPRSSRRLGGFGQVGAQHAVPRGAQRREAIALLRFVRSACAAGVDEATVTAWVLGAARRPNLVPIRALYIGPCGEKMLVHPFYAAGSLGRLLPAMSDLFPFVSFDFLPKLP